MGETQSFTLPCLQRSRVRAAFTWTTPGRAVWPPSPPTPPTSRGCGTPATPSSASASSVSTTADSGSSDDAESSPCLPGSRAGMQVELSENSLQNLLYTQYEFILGRSIY